MGTSYRRGITCAICAFFLYQVTFVNCQESPATGLGFGTQPDEEKGSVFLQELVDKYGKDSSITVSQLQQLIKNIKLNIKTDNDGSHQPSSPDVNSTDPQKNETSKKCSGGKHHSTECVTNQCLSADGIFSFHNLPTNTSANGDAFKDMSPTILYQLQNPKCQQAQDHRIRRRPSPEEVWGYGFLCVTLINLCALMGMVFLPLMRRSFYQKMLMFMVALAVGTLTGSGLIFLIPESFEMTAPDSEYKDYYIWRSLAVVGGIYLFFLVERLLKIFIKKRREFLDEQEALAALLVKQNMVLPNGPEGQKEIEAMPIASVPTHSTHSNTDTINMSFRPVPNNMQPGHNYQLKPDSSSTKLVEQSGDAADANGDAELQVFISNGGIAGNLKDKVANGLSNGHGHSHGDISDIKSVAWMVIIGDGLHNFIDGLSIGAAFSGSVMTGVSVSLAVICEELPHELGDFAILLNSGMSMKQALGYNFLSACMCYLGMAIGILVGEVTHGAVWIFAVAGGMFLYIALVDMLPEVNHAAEAEEEATGATWSVFLIQNTGLLSGISIMVLLAYFSGQITMAFS